MKSRALAVLSLFIALCVIATAALAQSQLPLFQYASALLSRAPSSFAMLTPDSLRHIESISEEPSFASFPTPPSKESEQSSTSTTQEKPPVIVATVATPPPVTAEPLFETEAVNAATRAASVNIFCEPENGGNPLSASGVIIDPRGIVLTNAHVAQYLLLRDAGVLALDCTLRTGSPAVNAWRLEVLYVSVQWINEHADEIRDERPLGTGENDYALLRITSTTNGGSLPSSFPFLPPAVGSAAAYPGQKVLLASYPAGFLGGASTAMNLNLVSTVTTVSRIISFGGGTFDIAALGGVIVAQTGSSGGAVANAAKQLVGIIVTTSLAAQTSERDLHAVTIAHISNSLFRETGVTLFEYLNSNISAQKAIFDRDAKPELTKKLIDGISQ